MARNLANDELIKVAERILARSTVAWPDLRALAVKLLAALKEAK